MILLITANGEKPKIKPPYGVDKVFVAIYDYDARTDEDLTFRVGDLLIILDDRLVYFSLPWILNLFRMKLFKY